MSEIMSKEANYSSADSSSSNKQKGRSILFLVRCFCSHKHTGAGKKWSPYSTWYLKCIFLYENNWVLIWFHLNLFPMVQLPIKITSENGSKLSNMQWAIAVTNDGPIYTPLTCQYRSQNLLDTAYIQPVTIYYQPSWSYFELFTWWGVCFLNGTEFLLGSLRLPSHFDHKLLAVFHVLTSDQTQTFFFNIAVLTHELK